MNILISGAASGIGRAAVERFLSQGHTVYALDISEIEQKDGVICYRADITNEQELCAVRDSLEREGVVLDAFILAAGIHKMASLAEDETELLRRVVEVNLIGTMLTCRILHARLAPRGRIVILTSEVASFDPLPFNGLYNVSKSALDTYAQALRQELNLIGQKVVTIRPGAVETPLASGSLTGTEALAERTVLYEKQSKHFLYFVKNFMGTPMKPERLAQKIYRVTVCRHPRPIYKVHHNLGLTLLSLLPKGMQCAVIKALLNRK